MSTTSMNSRTTKNCARCRNHNLKTPLKNHKRYCKFKHCLCEMCHSTHQRQKKMAEQTAARRARAQDEARLGQSSGTTPPIIAHQLANLHDLHSLAALHHHPSSTSSEPLSPPHTMLPHPHLNQNQQQQQQQHHHQQQHPHHPHHNHTHHQAQTSGVHNVQVLTHTSAPPLPINCESTTGRLEQAHALSDHLSHHSLQFQGGGGGSVHNHHHHNHHQARVLLGAGSTSGKGTVHAASSTTNHHHHQHHSSLSQSPSSHNTTISTTTSTPNSPIDIEHSSSIPVPARSLENTCDSSSKSPRPSTAVQKFPANATDQKSSGGRPAPETIGSGERNRTN